MIGFSEAICQFDTSEFDEDNGVEYYDSWFVGVTNKQTEPVRRDAVNRQRLLKGDA